MKTFILCMLLASLGGTVLAAAPAAPTTQPYQPVLLVGPGGWEAYRARVNGDARLASLRKWVIDEAINILAQPMVNNERPDGCRMSGGVQFLQRVLLLTQAYHLTGNKALADRAISEALVAAAFSDWNPNHYLDTAHCAVGTSLVLDWLHDELSVDQRKTLQRALIEKCLRTEEGHYFWTSENNWQQVCSSGVLLSAIMVRDVEPELAARMITKCRSFAYFGMRPYEPDGIPEEGPSYWHYGNSFSAISFSAMETALGVKAVDAMPPHFKKSAEVRSLLDGPSGQWFGYSDVIGTRCLEPAMFFMADKLDRPELLAGQWRLLGGLDGYLELTKREYPVRTWLSPLVLVWAGDDSGSEKVAPLPRVWSGGGKNPLALLRAGAGDTEGFVGIKGGMASNWHGHMDAGLFVVDLNRVRWAIDLGLEPYANIEKVIGGKLWDLSPNSPRWDLLRYNSLHHNTLTLNGRGQRVDGKATFLRTGEDPFPFAVVDLSTTYASRASRVTRGVRLLNERTFDVADVIEGVIDDQEITWTWITDAKIQEVSPTKLRLTKDGHSAWLTLASPAEARFQCKLIDDEKKEYESANPDVTAIRIKLKSASAKIVVRLSVDPEQAAAVVDDESLLKLMQRN
jgi:hypothetical protein